MNDKNLTDVIVETPAGCNVKYKYELQYKLFKLHKAMPEGMVFPYDFGFIPGTKGGDGDPLDVLVVSEFKMFPGSLVTCRIVGAIAAEQKDVNKDWVRNDRFIGIPEKSKVYAHIQTLKDISEKILSETEHFFKSYTSIEGKQFEILKRIDADEAFDLITQSRTL
jgi:inorganic pyrophosphatase